MRISDRQQQILSILEKEGFCTSNQLSERTYTSPSSIRRDLAALHNLGLITRTHGGASLTGSGTQAPALHNRMTKNVTEKRKIAKKAAAFLKDDMSVMLDGSSTASFLLPYLAERKNISLFTNSLSTAMRAIELGIKTHCLGGKAVRNSAVLAGEETCRAVSGLFVDVLFFSSQSVDEQGLISDSTEEENQLRKQMLQQARQRVFLCDSSKFNSRTLYTLTTLSHVDAAVFDQPFSGLIANCMIL